MIHFGITTTNNAFEFIVEGMSFVLRISEVTVSPVALSSSATHCTLNGKAYGLHQLQSSG